MSFFAVFGGIISAYGGPIAVTAIVAQGIGRAIPDNKKGVLGVIRKVAKVVGIYANPEQTQFNKQVESNKAVIDELITQAIAPAPNAFGKPRARKTQ